MFQKVDAYAGDPILSLMERFKEDPRSDKVNLSIGLYYNDDGIIPQLQAVAEAEARLNAEPHGASLYLPMEGLSGYRQAIAPLLFGAEHTALKQNRIASIQTVGGSGALKVGADFLKRYFPESHVWVSDPTWENHIAIFEGAGFEVSTYPWFDKATNGVRFEDLLATLQTLPARDIVLLHPCCHNPTGADLTPAQWDRVVEVLKARQLIPFLDIAYQGFGGGLEEDAYAIRAIASAGMPMLVSNSFSKIFSLYGERVGGLSVVCEDSETAGRVLGQHKGFVRYTKGQHKGLGLAIEPPLYVTKKDSATHAIYVGPSGALFTTELTAGEWNGIALAELTAPVTVSVKTRYSQREAEATAEPLLGGRFRLRFREPQRAVTPGQFAVLYDGEDVVGSGVILE